MYRTVQACFWTDPGVHMLSVEAKLMKLYLITNQHSHLSGIYHLPFSTIAYDTGVRECRIRSILDTLSGIRVDAPRMVVWVEKMLHYQARGEKAWRAAAAQLARLHNSPLIKDFLIGYPQVSQYCIESIRDGVSCAGSLKEEEEEEEEEKRSRGTPVRASVVVDSEWLLGLKKNAAYSHVNLEVEMGKMEAWLALPKNAKRIQTRSFVLNWLNKIEAPMTGRTGTQRPPPPPPKNDPIGRGQWKQVYGKPEDHGYE